jgi:hypothetical protein
VMHVVAAICQRIIRRQTAVGLGGHSHLVG